MNQIPQVLKGKDPVKHLPDAVVWKIEMRMFHVIKARPLNGVKQLQVMVYDADHIETYEHEYKRYQVNFIEYSKGNITLSELLPIPVYNPAIS